jgi:hypothetical protein
MYVKKYFKNTSILKYLPEIAGKMLILKYLNWQKAMFGAVKAGYLRVSRENTVGASKEAHHLRK